MVGADAFSLTALFALTVGCAEYVGPLPGSGSDASFGADARDMSTSDVSPPGDAAACTCSTGLFIDVVGDGDPLHLTSADVPLMQRGATENTVATQCFSPPIPWVEWTYGEIILPYYTDACAGPGSTPPCVLLNGVAIAPGSFSSSYVDRSGQTFSGDATLTFSPGNRQLMQSADGSYTLNLEDGRTLSGTLHVCLIELIDEA